MAQDEAELGLWTKTFQVASRNRVLCSVYVGAMMLIAISADFTSSGSGSSIAQAFAAALLAIPAHLTVLTGNYVPSMWGKNYDNKAQMRFVLRGFGLGALAFGMAMLLTFATLSFGVSQDYIVIVFLPIVLLFSALIFGRWGTMLPATVVNADYSLKAAGERGSKTWSYTFSRLLLSFGLLTILQLAVGLSITGISNAEAKFFPATGEINVPLLLGSLATNVIGAIQVVMTAVILSRAYLRAEAAKSV